MEASAAEPLQREAKRLGELGLQGWRKQVAAVAAPPLSKVTPLSRRELDAWIGLGFVALSAWYLGSTLARFLRTR
jgi:hypothetical protein